MSVLAIIGMGYVVFAALVVLGCAVLVARFLMDGRP